MVRYVDNVNKIKWANKENKCYNKTKKNKSKRLKIPNKTT